MINVKQLKTYVVEPVIKDLGFDKTDNSIRNAVALCLLTCAQESLCGKYIHQMGNGPAKGIGQMEPATYNDIVTNWLGYREDILENVCKAIYSDRLPPASALTGNLNLSIAMLRVLYYRTPDYIPEYNDLEGMWAMYKKHYNTYKGKATKEEFMHNAELVKEYL